MVSGNTVSLNYAGNDGTCDHSWLTMLFGNAPQKGVSYMFGEMEIYIYQIKAFNEHFLLAKVMKSLSVQISYYKQLKLVHKLWSNYGTIFVLALL